MFNYIEILFSFKNLGKGRGRQVIAVARTADLVVMMLDATKSGQQRILLERELEAVGIRLNRGKPNVYFKVLFYKNYIFIINIYVYIFNFNYYIFCYRLKQVAELVLMLP